MSQEPPWERAERYRQIMQAQGLPSVRALARTIGGDYSRIAKILKVVELPERVLAALRAHADNPRIRGHLTEARLRQFVRERTAEVAILREIEHVAEGSCLTSRHRASLFVPQTS